MRVGSELSWRRRGVYALASDRSAGAARSGSADTPAANPSEPVDAQCRERIGGKSGVESGDQIGDHFRRPAREAPARRAVRRVDEEPRMHRIAPTTGKPSGDSRLHAFPRHAPPILRARPESSRASPGRAARALPSSAPSPSGLSVFAALCSTAPPAMRRRWFMRVIAMRLTASTIVMCGAHSS